MGVQCKKVSSTKIVPKKETDNSLAISLQHLTGGFDFLINQTPIIVTIINKDGIILYQSPNVKNILGYDSQKRMGQNFIRSRLVHPDDVAIKQKLLAKAFKTPNANFIDEMRLQHKNGTWCWLESIFNNQLTNPKVRGIVVISYDINKRKLSELQKNEFLSIASHELKTPLTTIRAYGQLLLKRFAKEEKKEQELQFLENIVFQTGKLKGLIDDLLDVSKLQEGKFSVQSEPFQMQVLVKKIIADFHITSESRVIELVQTTKTYVIGDEFRITQVIMNLLTNAIKYSPDSSRIEMGIKRIGKYVVTNVTDHGEGIPVSKQKFVFDRFFKIDNGKNRPGSTGLGLYIAAEIVKLHKGKIWLSSKKGKGSTFYFSLPVTPQK